MMRQARGKGASLTPMSTRCCRWSDLDGQRHAINQRWRSPFEPCGWHRTSEVRRASAGDLRSGGRRREVWSAGPGRNGSHQEWTRTALACAAEAKAPTSESASEVVFTTRLRGFIQRMSRYDIFETGHFTDGGPTVAGTNPAVVAVFARALTTFSQRDRSPPTVTPSRDAPARAINTSTEYSLRRRLDGM